jgi:hypothetical protein
MHAIAELLDGVAHGSSLGEVWHSSRLLMRDKRRGTAAGEPLLLKALQRLSEWAARGNDVHRLVAIDLLVRIPASIRKIQRVAQPLRAEVLRLPIPPYRLSLRKRIYRTAPSLPKLEKMSQRHSLMPPVNGYFHMSFGQLRKKIALNDAVLRLPGRLRNVPLI